MTVKPTDELRLADAAIDAVRYMDCGMYSIGIYGVGSKILVLHAVQNVIDEIAKHSSQKAPPIVIRVPGYDEQFPLLRTIVAKLTQAATTTNTTIGSVKRRIVTTVPSNTNCRTHQDVLQLVTKVAKTRRIYVLVDSIDAAPMRQNQTFFSDLAQISNVSLCASVDHSKVGLLWSPSQLRKFSWYWMEASTYQAYTKEVSGLVPLWRSLIEGGIDPQCKAAAAVIQNLTGSHKSAVETLARMQLDLMNSTGNRLVKIRSSDFLKVCHKKMIVTSLPKLKSMMVELLDHKVVLEGQDKETGNEMYWIPLDRAALESMSICTN